MSLPCSPISKRPMWLSPKGDQPWEKSPFQKACRFFAEEFWSHKPEDEWLISIWIKDEARSGIWYWSAIRKQIRQLARGRVYYCRDHYMPDRFYQNLFYQPIAFYLPSGELNPELMRGAMTIQTWFVEADRNFVIDGPFNKATVRETNEIC